MAYDVHADPELDWSDDYVEVAETLSTQMRHRWLRGTGSPSTAPSRTMLG